ncbi:hypothetical protein EYF80_018528 [Liparis tanakae]|uniref:Uncharacterized protein n=1 Tax=Liparis tanakae TaxID=230148 RepID=A0A4Z2I047_9TELE|nr:hypothetical protein EYF80_018528 [Liparis tanakae]
MDGYKEGESEIFVSKTLVDEMQRMLMVMVGGRRASPSLPVSGLWQAVLSMLDMPCSPQALVLLWSAKSQGQIACNRPLSESAVLLGALV